jgi:hypothetical protein
MAAMTSSDSQTHPPSVAKILHLELVVGSDPIQGSLREPSRPAAGFLGWVQLTAALERASQGEFLVSLLK